MNWNFFFELLFFLKYLILIFSGIPTNPNSLLSGITVITFEFFCCYRASFTGHLSFKADTISLLNFIRYIFNNH